MVEFKPLFDEFGLYNDLGKEVRHSLEAELAEIIGRYVYEGEVKPSDLENIICGVAGLECTKLAASAKMLANEELCVYAAIVGEGAKEAVVTLLLDLWANNISAETDFTGRSLKSQMKLADKYGAKFVLIIGDDEVAKGIVTLRDMITKEQKEIAFDKVAEEIVRICNE